MQRNRVVLPDPLGPITTTTSPGAIDSDTSLNTRTAPKDLLMPETSSIGRRSIGRTSMAVEDTALKMSAIKRKGIADAEIDGSRSDEDLKRREVRSTTSRLAIVNSHSPTIDTSEVALT